MVNPFHLLEIEFQPRKLMLFHPPDYAIIDIYIVKYSNIKIYLALKFEKYIHFCLSYRSFYAVIIKRLIEFILNII